MRAEPRWLSIRFTMISVAAGAILFLILYLAAPRMIDFHPNRTEQLMDENAVMEVQLFRTSFLANLQRTQLVQLQENRGTLDVLLNEHSMFDDSSEQHSVSLAVFRRHAFVPKDYFPITVDRYVPVPGE